MVNETQMERVLNMLAPMYDSDLTRLVHDRAIEYLNNLPGQPGQTPEENHQRYVRSVAAYSERIIKDAVRVFSQRYIENATMAYVEMRHLQRVLGANAAEFEANLAKLNKELNDNGNSNNPGTIRRCI